MFRADYMPSQGDSHPYYTGKRIVVNKLIIFMHSSYNAVYTTVRIQATYCTEDVAT
jgi:hypothetical protein